MSLYFGTLYWPTTHPQPRRYPALRGPVRTKAVIIGGGMSGVTCGYELASSGIDAVLIEQNRVASGSTSTNTGLLQYTNDTMLSEFSGKLGEETAANFYKACELASERLHVIAERLPRDVQFKKRRSIYYASAPDDAPSLRKEYEMLNKHGFNAQWWDEEKIASRFPFAKSAAIVTSGDAEVNPFLFVHALAEEAYVRGLAIYESTAMLSVETARNGYIVRTTGGDVHADHVIYAVGYVPEEAGGRWVKAQLNRSYAIVTEPLPSLAEWHERDLIWETARPYLYARTTADNRMIAGGLDENVRHPVLSERGLRTRSLRLLSELNLLFPDYKPAIRYEWCATFGNSQDGLPWIGEDPDRPGQHYMLGYGGNGTIYSMLGAEIIRDRLTGVHNPIADIVRPDRNFVPTNSNV